MVREGLKNVCISVITKFLLKCSKFDFSWRIYKWGKVRRLHDYYNMLEVFGNSDKEEYIRRIALWKYSISGNDGNIKGAIKEISDLAQRKLPPQNAVLVLGEFLSGRMLKILEALHGAGEKIVFLEAPNCYDRDKVKSEILTTVDFYVKCNCVEEVFYHFLLYQSVPKYIFSDWKDPKIAYLTVRMKDLFKAVIVERYDIFTGFYTYPFVEEIARERFCLENADGVVIRYWAEAYLKEQGVSIKGIVLHFPDYFSKAHMKKVTINENGLSLVVATSFLTEEEAPDGAQACFLEFVKLCEKNRCHFHLYPNDYNEKRLINYIKEDKKNEYFHLHRPVPFNELIDELSQYDYGVFPVRKIFRNKEVDANFTKAMVMYGCSNKFYDDLAAGLPIVSPIQVKLIESMEKFGLVFPWAIEEIDFRKLRDSKVSMKLNVERNREFFCMENHIKELIAFYNKIQSLAFE